MQGLRISDDGADRRSDGEAGPTGAAPRLYERAAAILRARIETGALPPGEHLSESAIAEEFGISRPPARRALVELARAGAIEKAEGRGYRVAEGAATRRGASPSDGVEENVRLHSLPSWERIYGEVENELIARISFSNWRINEARLARHYDVSRTVARDVVGRLQQRGIVRKDDRSRWYAPALTPQHIGELYELRAILEPVALVKAAPHVPAAYLQDMRAHLDEAASSPREIGGTTLDRLEQEMHVDLLGHCGNDALMQAITLPQSLLIAHRFLYRWTQRLFDSEPFLPEHIEVVDRLEHGHAAGAADALRRHLEVSRDRAVARVDVIRRDFDADDLPHLGWLARG